MFAFSRCNMSGDVYFVFCAYFLWQEFRFTLIPLSCAFCSVACVLCVRFFQGRESSQDEIGASAVLAKEMDDKLNDAAVQVLRSGAVLCCAVLALFFVWVVGSNGCTFRSFSDS